jgi:hypothetical protein
MKNWTLFKKENSKNVEINTLITIYRFFLLYLTFLREILLLKGRTLVKNDFFKEINLFHFFNKKFFDNKFQINIDSQNNLIIIENNLMAGKNTIFASISEKRINQIWDSISIKISFSEIYKMTFLLEKTFVKEIITRGIFYTPPKISKILISETIKTIMIQDTIESITILDSSCGTGNFLISCLEFVEKIFISEDNNKKVYLPKLKNFIKLQLHGIDNDLYATIISKLRIFLFYFKNVTYKDVEIVYDELLLSNIIFGNFLELKENIKPTIIIGNPPWGKLAKNDVKYKLREKFPLQGGQLDYYRFFLEAILKIEPKFITLITPDTWLEIPGARNLKNDFFKKFFFKNIFLLPTKVFDVKVNFFGFLAVNNNKKLFNNVMVNFFEINSELEIFNSFKNVFSNKYIRNYSLENKNIINNGIHECAMQLTSNIDQVKLDTIIECSIGYQLYHKTIHSKEVIEKKVFHSNSKTSPEMVKEITSKSLKLLAVNRENTNYVNFSVQFFRIPPKRFFESEKILLREIISKNGFIVARSNQKDFFPKTIISILPKNQKYILFILGYLLSYVCLFDFLFHGIKSDQKYFPRVSINSLKNLNFNLELLSSDIDSIVTNLEKYSEEKNKENEFVENFSLLQAKVFYCYKFSIKTAEMIMDFLHVLENDKKRILKIFSNLK